MITNIKIELGDDDRRSLHLALTGKKGMATRDEVKNWALKLLGERLSSTDPTKNGPVRLQNVTCPKCQRPISVAVPAVQRAPSPLTDAKYAKACESAKNATIALEKALADLRGAL